MKGTTVILLDRIKTGETRLREPVFEEVEIPVSNVLIAPVSGADLPTEYDFDGKKTVYVLAIPKEDRNTWKDRRVRFWGETWKVVGEPVRGMDELIPLDWNMKVTVERYE